jgi:hypothetical protein
VILRSKIVKQVKCCASIKGLERIGNLNEGVEQQHVSVHPRPVIAVTRIRNMGKRFDFLRTGKLQLHTVLLIYLCRCHYSKIYHLIYLMECEDQDKQNSKWIVVLRFEGHT